MLRFLFLLQTGAEGNFTIDTDSDDTDIADDTDEEELPLNRVEDLGVATLILCRILLDNMMIFF